MHLEYTAEFKRDLRNLGKKYRHIQQDIQPVIEQLQAGKLVGDQIPGIGYTLFKVRVRNSDVQKGKRSGYRLIYYLRTSRKIILVNIYSKSDQGDISAHQIWRILDEYS
ncbi:MAG: type II toxin-antitoxin system RelE/ParE family toxin [Gammaproteobacteria bacterium]|nr:type II toxin-antitoxin system RelE/ParE family toxin [Gammaproteobacteria bacterium]